MGKLEILYDSLSNDEFAWGFVGLKVWLFFVSASRSCNWDIFHTYSVQGTA